MAESNKELAVIEMYMKDVENLPQLSDEEKEDSSNSEEEF